MADDQVLDEVQAHDQAVGGGLQFNTGYNSSPPRTIYMTSKNKFKGATLLQAINMGEMREN